MLHHLEMAFAILLLVAISVHSTLHLSVDLQKCSLVKFDLNNLDDALLTYKECLSLLGKLPSDVSTGLMKTLHEKMDLAWANLANKEGHQVIRRALARAVEEGINSDDVAVWAVSADLGDSGAEQNELSAQDNALPSSYVAEFIADTYNILMVWSMTSLVVLAGLLLCATYFLLKASRSFAKRVKKRTYIPEKRSSPSLILPKNKKRSKIPTPSKRTESFLELTDAGNK